MKYSSPVSMFDCSVLQCVAVSVFDLLPLLAGKTPQTPLPPSSNF